MSTWTRGVRIAPRKEPAASREIADCRPAETVLAPLSYGGAGCIPVVQPGSAVTAGGLLGRPDEENGLPAAATVTGVYEGTRTLSHPVCGEVVCALLRPERGQTRPAGKRARQLDALEARDILEAARRAAIIDELDGVPLYDKLEQWGESGIDVLAADATEAEPYASSAWAVLNDAAEDVYQGLQLAARAAGAGRAHIAVQLPPGRRRPLSQRLGDEAVFQVRSRYPVDRVADAPPGAAVGRVGVQAGLALYRAAAFEEPQISGVLTVAGDAVANPQNLRVPFGMSAREALHFCGLAADPELVILGDAMTGVTADSLDVPLLPGITCLLALRPRPAIKQRPCMGCGRCARVCHARLLPYEIVRRLENMHYERLATLSAEECDGCGACSYVCPAGRDVTAKVLEAKLTRGTIFLNWGDDEDA